MKLFLMLIMLMILGIQSVYAKSGRCKAHMRDGDDNIIDTFSVWTPHYNRACQLALNDCNRIMDSRIRNGETELNKGQCTAEWSNPLPTRPRQRMAKNYCSVYIKNTITSNILETFIDLHRGPKGFLSWMTACNKAMTKCMRYLPTKNRKNLDCVREEFKD